jgi:quercetin dioxygenase-like cupin family protein
MAHAGQVFDDGAVRLEVLVTGADSDGALHEMRATYRAGCPFPPAHLHPAQDERFEVLEGRLLFLVDGTEHVVGAGETIAILRGRVHQARNPFDEPAVALWQTRPALRSSEFFEAVAAAREQGLEQLLAVVAEYADVFELAVQPEG